MKGINEANRLFDLIGEKLLPDLSTSSISKVAGEKITRTHLKKVSESTGAIRVITAIDFMKLRVHNFLMFFLVKDKDQKFDMHEKLCRLPFASRVATISGSKADFMVHFRTNEYSHVHNVIYPAIAEYKDLLKVEAVYPAFPVYDLLIHYPEASEPPHEKISLLDWKILSEIKEDALKTYKEIGKKVGVSEHTVRNRIKKMHSKGVIKGYIVVRVWDKYPAEQVPVIGLIGLTGKEKGMHNFLNAFMESNAFNLCMYHTYGKYAYLIEFRIGSMIELQKLIKRLPKKDIRVLDFYTLFDQTYPNWAESVVKYWKK